MTVSCYIHELEVNECHAIMDELLRLDVNVKNKTNYILKTNPDLTLQEALEFVVHDSPTLWAKVYLDWEARDYQLPILDEGKKSKKLVLRLGRRLGKTDDMIVLILWYACTQRNKGPNNQYDILIMTPYETQIDLIYKRMKQLIDGSPLLTSLVTKDVHHLIHITPGETTTTILGLTAGANNGSNGGNNSRGQRADLIILDEVDRTGKIA